LYLDDLKEPFDLLTKGVEWSRDKYLAEFAKLEAWYEEKRFYTEEGINERKQKIKMKVLLAAAYG